LGGVIFPYEPALTQYLADPVTGSQIGDIRQPWIDLSARCGVSEFSAKALFAVGLMVQYVESADAVLEATHFRGFLSAFRLMASSIELLGRCVHPDIAARQHPHSRSGDRLTAGFEFMQPSHLPAGVIVETNHHRYSERHLKTLRNFTTHGACVEASIGIHADIELLHEVRKAFFGVLDGEDDPHRGRGPIVGAIDRFFDHLVAGDVTTCEYLASAAVSPAPLILHGGGWHFASQVVVEMHRRIEENSARGVPAVIGGYTKAQDHFRLYP
jgi:hypothetical protein